MTEETKLILDELNEIKSDMSDLKGDFKEMRSDVNNLKDDFKEMRSDVNNLKDDFKEMRLDVDTLKDRFDKLESNVGDMKLTLENETNRNIKIIAEGHLDLSRKFDEALKVENEKELLLIRVNHLENEVRQIKEKNNAIA